MQITRETAEERRPRGKCPDCGELVDIFTEQEVRPCPRCETVRGKKLATEWNAAHPIGTPVIITKYGKKIHAVITEPALGTGGMGLAYVFIDGMILAVSLD